jgi:ATP-dependent helicase Lhr and Lhr-like helicase
MQRDHGLDTRDILESVANKIVKIRPALVSTPLLVAIESLPLIIFGLYGKEDVPVFVLTAAATLPTMPSRQPGTNGDRDELLPNLLEQWLRYYGPLESESIGPTLGIDEEELSLAIEDLSDSQMVIEGQLVTGKTKDHICDSENYEVLLRMARRAAVPAFEAIDIRYLPLFLAQYQGLNTAEGDVDALYHCLERLRCLPLAADIWEAEILPARLHNYLPSWLDDIMQEGNLRWVGSEKRTIALLFEEDLPLFQTEPGTPKTTPPNDGHRRIFPHNLGRYDFSTLLRITGLSSGELSDLLWKGVWRGEVTNDTFAALRKGIMTRFEPPRLAAPGGRRANAVSFSRWKATLPFAGNWFLLPEGEPNEDILEMESQLKERARILLERYGILFRELLEREAPLFRWPRVFRALRLMELSGEVLSGYFFKDIPGPQFITLRAFQTLQSRLPENKTYWVNAVDPASICGVQIETIKGSLPKRIAGNHVVYHGSKPVVISERNGRVLTIKVPPDDENLPGYFSFMRNLLSRQFQPLHRITIDTMNGERAADSTYVTALKTSFDVMTQNDSLVVYRKMNAQR